MSDTYQWKPQPVVISGKYFDTKRDARFHVESLLRDYALDQPIEGEDQEFLLDLFSSNIKVNIARDKDWISTVTRSNHAMGSAVFVRRTGMPPIVCSWRKAIQELRAVEPKPKPKNRESENANTHANAC